MKTDAHLPTGVAPKDGERERDEAVALEPAGVSVSLRSRLSRKTSGGRFLPAIDGLRFVAIASVLLVHTTGFVFGKFERHLNIPVRGSLLGQTLHGGMYGVQLFFIISGFVLGLPFAARRLQDGPVVRLPTYFWRRITRLEPPYLVAMVIVLAMGVLLHGDSLAGQTPHFLAGLPYLHWVFYPEHNPVNPATWSLEVEIQFYVLVPLLTQVFRISAMRVRRGVLVGAAAASALLAHLFVVPGSAASQTIVTQLPFFLMGFLLVDVYLTTWRSAPKTGRAWDAVFLGTLVAAWLVITTPHHVWWALPIVGFVFCCAAFRSPIASRFLSRPWIYTIGGMCYSIYLLHLPIIRLAWGATGDLVPPGHFELDVLVQALILIPLALVFSAIFFVLVERPCMDRGWPAKLAAWFRSPRFATQAPRTESSPERSQDELAPH